MKWPQKIIAAQDPMFGCPTDWIPETPSTRKNMLGYEAVYIREETQVPQAKEPKKKKRLHPKPNTLTEIKNEVVRARTKFPGNAKMLAALMEEVGELAKALLQRKNLEDVRKEAVQVAAVAIRIIEEGDSDFKTDDWNSAL